MTMKMQAITERTAALQTLWVKMRYGHLGA